MNAPASIPSMTSETTGRRVLATPACSTRSAISRGEKASDPNRAMDGAIHQLAQFAVPQYQARHRGAQQPLVELERHRTEGEVEEAEVDDRHLEQDRQRDRAPQPRV